jgi:hypothetical protein
VAAVDYGDLYGKKRRGVPWFSAKANSNNAKGLGKYEAASRENEIDETARRSTKEHDSGRCRRLIFIPVDFERF